MARPVRYLGAESEPLPTDAMVKDVLLSSVSSRSTWESQMWTKPEFEIVEVTMEVTAYVARR